MNDQIINDELFNTQADESKRTRKGLGRPKVFTDEDASERYLATQKRRRDDSKK